MKKGSQYLAGKDYRKAIIEFKVASQNMPKDAGPIYQLGMTYLSAGANRLAAEAFQKAIALDPKHEAAQYQLALFKAGASQPELLHEAKRVISAWTLSHPNDADAFASLGLVEAKLGNRAEAIRGLETGVAKDGSTIGIASAVISVYAARGDGDAGKEVARELAEKLPRSPEAAILHAEALLAAHDTAGADAEISRALGLKEDFRPALQLRLRRELATGDTSHAEQTTLALSRLPQKDLWGAYARQLFSENKIDQGMAEFEQALKQHNNDVSLRDEYAAALLRAGQSKEAEAVVAGTLKENPKAVPALMLRASIEIDSGRLDAASKDLRALRELKAFSARLSFLESHLFSARGETIRAADSLVEALKMDPGMFIARRELVRLLCLAGKGKNAVLVLDEAPAEQKHSAEFVLSRNLALLTAGDWDEARRSVDAALAVARMPGFLYQDAVLRLRKEDLAGARKSLEEAFRLAPSDTATIRMLGAIMRRQGEFPRFLEMVEDASRDNAATAPFQNELGSLLEGEGDRKGSRAVFEAAKSEGAVFDPEIGIALLELRSDDVDAARERLMKLVKVHDSVRARMALVEIEMRSGSGDGAMGHYLKALELEPGNVAVMNNLAGYLAFHEKNYDDALFWAQKALALAPGSPDIEDTVGWTYYLTGKYDRAEAYLEKSAKAADRPVAHYHLAAVLARTGKFARGREEYDLALRQDPQSPERRIVAPLYEN
jgi:tetratricopeptide (TPR) repeat protein